MKLNPRALGLTAGIIWGLCLLLSTWWSLLLNTGGTTLELIKNFYLGYEVSFLGSLIGLVWGFVDGLICGYVFALLYNMLSKEKAVE